MNENRIRLMAWVWMPGADRTIFCEIDSAEAESRTAWVVIEDHIPNYCQAVPFSALQSIALCDGPRTLQAFGRPFASQPVPEWVQYAEVG